jgi:PAS domain S-box-containing protein
VPALDSSFPTYSNNALYAGDGYNYYVLEVNDAGKIINANKQAAVFYQNPQGKNLTDLFSEHSSNLLLADLKNVAIHHKYYPRKFYTGLPGQVITFIGKLYAGYNSVIIIKHFPLSIPQNQSNHHADHDIKMLTESHNLGIMGSYDYDLATDVVVWTSNTYKIFGIADGTPLNFDKAISAYSASDAKKLIALSELALNQGSGFEMEALIRRMNDKRQRNLLIRCEVKRDAELKVTGLRGIVQDITERKKVELEQQESRNLLNSIFSTSLIQLSVLKAVKDENGELLDFTILVVNGELEKAMGRNDLIGKFYTEEYPGIREAGILDVMVRVLKAGKPAQAEYHYKHNSIEKWFTCMYSKLDDGLVVTYIDISERKRSDLEKHRNLLLLQQSEEVAQSGTWEYNLTSGKLTWSEGMYRIYQIRLNTQIIPEIYATYATQKSKRTIDRLISLIKSGSNDFSETFEISTANQQKVIKQKSVVIRDYSGIATSVLGVDMDITDIKKAEKRILEDAAMIKAIADIAPDMLYILDMQELSVIYANENAAQLFGNITKNNIADRHLLRSIVYPEDKPKFDEHIADLINSADKEIKETILRILDARKRICWIRTKAVVYQRSNEGKPTHAIHISQDITEQINLQKKNEEVLRKREKLEKEQQREIFDLAINDHEEERRRIAENFHNGLGQLLYGVKLYFNKLNLTENEVFSHEHRSAYLKINDLITQTIQESRRLSHELSPIALEDFGLIASLKDLCENYKDFMQIKCSFKGELNELSKKMQIYTYRIVNELMLNIFKHAGAGECKLQIALKKKNVYIQVVDNGIGFDPDKINHNGVGLRTIQNKISMLGGSFIMSSTPPGGTQITIIIPINTP